MKLELSSLKREMLLFFSSNMAAVTSRSNYQLWRFEAELKTSKYKTYFD